MPVKVSFTSTAFFSNSSNFSNNFSIFLAFSSPEKALSILRSEINDANLLNSFVTSGKAFFVFSISLSRSLKKDRRFHVPHAANKTRLAFIAVFRPSTAARKAAIVPVAAIVEAIALLRPPLKETRSGPSLFMIKRPNATFITFGTHSTILRNVSIIRS